MGLRAPELIIILIVANFLKRFRENRYVQHAMYGIRPASVAMITYACLLVAKAALRNTDLYQATGNIGDLISWKAVVLGIVILSYFSISSLMA